MTHGRRCKHCKKLVAVRKNGLLWHHRVPGGGGRTNYGGRPHVGAVCPGSGTYDGTRSQVEPIAELLAAVDRVVHSRRWNEEPIRRSSPLLAAALDDLLLVADRVRQ